MNKLIRLGRGDPVDLTDCGIGQPLHSGGGRRPHSGASPAPAPTPAPENKDDYNAWADHAAAAGVSRPGAGPLHRPLGRPHRQVLADREADQ